MTLETLTAARKEITAKLEAADVARKTARTKSERIKAEHTFLQYKDMMSDNIAIAYRLADSQ